MNAFTDVWVSPAGSYNLLQTAPFAAHEQARLQRLPGVRAVRLYRGGLLDWGDRRTWVIAPPRASTPLLPASQIVEGNVQQATARVRAGGWAVLTQAIAEEHHLHIGSTFTLPTPNPTPMRLAALSTNIGWAPGAIVMNASDYARAWGSQDALRLQRPARPRRLRERRAHRDRTRARPAYGPRCAERRPARRPPEHAQPPGPRAPHADRHADPDRRRAGDGRRDGQHGLAAPPRLAKLKLEGFPVGELWRTIILESVLLVGVGCVSGALFGLYGQQLLDRALANVIGFPVVYSFGALTALTSLLIVTLASVLIVALPGYLATGVPPAVALQD